MTPLVLRPTTPTPAPTTGPAAPAGSIGARTPSAIEARRAAEACEQFEAVLVRQFFTEAQKTSLTRPSPGESPAMRQVYSDMVADSVSNAVARSGQLGLRATLQQQLLRHGAAGGTVG